MQGISWFSRTSFNGHADSTCIQNEYEHWVMEDYSGSLVKHSVHFNVSMHYNASINELWANLSSYRLLQVEVGQTIHQFKQELSEDHGAYLLGANH